MKKRINIKLFQLIVILFVIVTSTSCSDKFFDEQAGDRITPDKHYKSMNDAQASLAGAFSPLQKALPNLILIDGLLSDQMNVTPNTNAYLREINEHSFAGGNPYLDASDYYKVIINANEAIANLSKISKIDRDFDDKMYKSNLYALESLKSWTYLTLVRLYGKAVLIDNNLTELPQVKSVPLEKQVMIDTLINRLVRQIPPVNTIEYRFGNYMNGKAVLGELYLEKGDYANAVKYLTLAIESYQNWPRTNVYKVDGFASEGWRFIFNAENNTGGLKIVDPPHPEIISAVPYDMFQSQFNPLPTYMLPIGNFEVIPSQNLINTFMRQVQSAAKPDTSDVFRGLGTLESGPATLDTTSTGEYYINKYSIYKSNPYSSPIVISRAADLHLLLAEALNRSNNSKIALILLNGGFKSEKSVPPAYNKWKLNIGIRGRAYLKPVIVPDSLNGEPAVEGSAAYIEYVEDLIIEERSMELAFEGKRWFDLVRIAERRTGTPNYIADKVTAKFSAPEQSAMKEMVRTKLLIPANWYLPFSNELIK